LGGGFGVNDFFVAYFGKKAKGRVQLTVRQCVNEVMKPLTFLAMLRS
jgi:hypothetical protein